MAVAVLYAALVMKSRKNTDLCRALFFTLVCKRGAPEIMLPNHSGTAGRELPAAMPV